MPRIALIALTTFDHNGRSYTAGDRFDEAAIHAAMLTYRHKSRFVTASDGVPAQVPAVVEAEPVAEPEPVPTPTRKRRTRRTYRRRDMVAE